jgi:hypothetical protein
VYPFARKNIGGEDIRIFKMQSAAIGGSVFATDRNNEFAMTIENVLPGILYKTGDLTKPE